MARRVRTQGQLHNVKDPSTSVLEAQLGMCFLAQIWQASGMSRAALIRLEAQHPQRSHTKLSFLTPSERLLALQTNE